MLTVMRATARVVLAFAEWTYRYAALLLIPASAVLITIDAVLRYAFDAPLIWSKDVAAMMLFLLFMLCLPFSMRGNFHVRMDLIYGSVRPAIRRAMDVVGHAGAFVILLLMANHAWATTKATFLRGTTLPSGNLILWPFHLVATICLVWFALAILLAAFLPMDRVVEEQTKAGN